MYPNPDFFQDFKKPELTVLTKGREFLRLSIIKGYDNAVQRIPLCFHQLNVILLHPWYTMYTFKNGEPYLIAFIRRMEKSKKLTS